MNLWITNQVMSSATQLLDDWRAGKLRSEDFEQFMAMAKENGDWVQISAIALAVACIYEENDTQK